MEKISVIVPVYNVERYLERCLKSIMEQTYTNIEIILVDDGSTDESGKICDFYAQRDSRIQVYHQINKGLSAARNTGLDKIQGDFITFIDSDDYIADNYIELLYYMLKKNNADIAGCAGLKFYDGDIILDKGFRQEENVIFSNVEALESMLYRTGVNSYAWGKLYKKNLFQEIRFPIGMLFEDVRTIYKVYHMAECIVINPVELYYYYQRKGSIVNSAFSRKKIEQVTAAKEIFDFVKLNYPSLEKAAASKYFIAAVDVYRRIPNKKEFLEEQKYLKQIIRQYRCIVFSDTKNKKITRLIALISLFSMNGLNIAGRLYQLLIEKEIIRMKNPI